MNVSVGGGLITAIAEAAVNVAVWGVGTLYDMATKPDPAEENANPDPESPELQDTAAVCGPADPTALDIVGTGGISDPLGTGGCSAHFKEAASITGIPLEPQPDIMPESPPQPSTANTPAPGYE